MAQRLAAVSGSNPVLIFLLITGAANKKMEERFLSFQKVLFFLQKYIFTKNIVRSTSCREMAAHAFRKISLSLRSEHRPRQVQRRQGQEQSRFAVHHRVGPVAPVLGSGSWKVEDDFFIFCLPHCGLIKI